MAGVAISGATGFVGTHLRLALRRDGAPAPVPVPRAAFADEGALALAVAPCDTVVHLAARNRGDADEVYATNVELVDRLVTALDQGGRAPHVVFASSTQARAENAYGRSKRDGADRLARWATRAGAPLTVLEIPNVYGPGCRPFRNSFVATFCHLLARGAEPEVEVDRELDLLAVEDLATLVSALARGAVAPGTTPAWPVDTAKVSGVLAVLSGFRDARDEARVPALRSRLERNLHRTFLSHVDPADLGARPPLRADDRGALFEVVRSEASGQIFCSTTRPGVTRGEHYHLRKGEKFCVIAGRAVIRLRPVGGDEVTEHLVSGDRPEVVDIPVLHVHHIENVGADDLLTLFWADEIFDPQDPDTYPEAVRC